MSKEPIIGWWSGGVTSAVACKLTQNIYGKDRVRMVFIDTRNEDEDTYRFMEDCQNWYDVEIETITSNEYQSVRDVWYKHLSLNVANGAVCSYKMKRVVREKWQKDNPYEHQVFGFDSLESRRAMALRMNHPKVKPIFPLMFYGMVKKDCIDLLQEIGIEPPRTYRLGFHNNNCFNTGCVQGGIGYWQKIKREYPDKFEEMAKVEHELTDLKGEPVTMLKDQAKGGGLLFLKPHPDYPETKDISQKKGREPKPLMECNGFCGTNDLEKPSQTYLELNLDNE
jgi:PP-loop superfamily ATP-utilizing enzyme